MLHLTVAQDGSGDYASVSEAVLAVPYELERLSIGGDCGLRDRKALDVNVRFVLVAE